MPERTECIRCKSERVVHGALGGGPTAGFHPSQTKVFRISLDSPNIAIQRKESCFCIECGLVWTNAVDLNKAMARIIHWGTDELNSSLGLSDAAVIRDET